MEIMRRYTLDELAAMPDQTDWARVDAMTDEELTANALADPNNPPLTEEEFQDMRPAREVLPETMGPEMAAELLNHKVRPGNQKTKPDHISQTDWDDVDIPELTDADFQRMRPAHEVLPEILGPEMATALLNSKDRPNNQKTKVA